VAALGVLVNSFVPGSKRNSVFPLDHLPKLVRVDVNSQARFNQCRGAASVSEGEIFLRKPFANQKPVVTSFKITNLIDGNREMTTRRREDSRLPHLAAQLITQTRPVSHRGESQTG
jgi:hypothetical protein